MPDPVIPPENLDPNLVKTDPASPLEKTAIPTAAATVSPTAAATTATTTAAAASVEESITKTALDYVKEMKKKARNYRRKSNYGKRSRRKRRGGRGRGLRSYGRYRSSWRKYQQKARTFTNKRAYNFKNSEPRTYRYKTVRKRVYRKYKKHAGTAKKAYKKTWKSKSYAATWKRVRAKVRKQTEKYSRL